MFLTLQSFLAHFPLMKITKEDFVKKFIITYSSRPTLADLFALKSVIKSTDDQRYINRDKIVDYFYDVIIINRHKYLTEFYKSYFELPEPYELKWDGIKILTDISVNYNETQLTNICHNYQNNPKEHYDKMLLSFNQLIDNKLPGLSLQKNDMSRKIVRNINYLDILHYTQVTNTCKCKTSFWQSLINVYNKLELEDRFFAPSSIGLFLREKKVHDQIQTNYNNFFYLFQQYQPKASILNPYTVNWILKNLYSGTKIFTPVLSWVSYIVAFMHSDWEHYVGVDVMSGVCDRTRYIFDYYQNQLKLSLSQQSMSKIGKKEIDRLNKKHIDLYCQPSESLLYDSKFINQYHNYFDGILLCPPYFNMEIYPEGQQSIDLYPNYQEWLTKYWEDTVALCHIVLAQGKRFGFIINNYVSLKKEEYPLIQDLNMIALKYFKLVGAYNLLNRVSPLRVNHKKRTEMLFLYEK